MIQFMEIIRAIDAELRIELQPEAFNWADRTLDDAHKKAIDRFDRAIIACEARSDWASLQVEANLYRDSMLKILRAYKASKNIDEQTSFLESLRA